MGYHLYVALGNLHTYISSPLCAAFQRLERGISGIYGSCDTDERLKKNGSCRIFSTTPVLYPVGILGYHTKDKSCYGRKEHHQSNVDRSLLESQFSTNDQHGWKGEAWTGKQ